MNFEDMSEEEKELYAIKHRKAMIEALDAHKNAKIPISEWVRFIKQNVYIERR